jgi:hypothetical protein
LPGEDADGGSGRQSEKEGEVSTTAEHAYGRCNFCGDLFNGVIHRWHDLALCFKCGDAVAELDARLSDSRIRDGEATGQTGDFYEAFKKIASRPRFAGVVEGQRKDIPMGAQPVPVVLGVMPVAATDHDQIPDEVTGGGIGGTHEITVNITLRGVNTKGGGQ